MPRNQQVATSRGRRSWLRALGTRVEPRERRETAGAFLTLFGFMMGHALLETARDAMFLARLPASQLPWVYLAIAVVALALTGRQGALLRRFAGPNELAGWLIFAAAGSLVFWSLAGLGHIWVFYAVYVWTGVLATLVVVRFWTRIGGLFTVTQAKRIFTIVGSGSVLGAIAGSGLARALADSLAPRQLVLAAAIVFIAATPAPRLLRAGSSRDDSGLRFRSIPTLLRGVSSDGYLRRIAIMIVLAAMTFSLVDYLFKSAADRAVAPADLGEFFATVYLVLNVLALVVQLGVVSALVRRFGVNRALAFVPALLLLGSGALAAGGGLLLALALKGADGSMRHSLFRTGSELLFVAIPIDLRTRAKPIVDVVGQRGGQVVAALFLLALIGVGAGDRLVALLAVGVTSVWLWLTLDLRSHYLNVFRGSLEADFAPRRHELEGVDLATQPLVLEALDSPDPGRVVAALDLLAETGAASRIGTGLLDHPDRRVVVHALALLGEEAEEDFDIPSEMLDSPDLVVREAAYRASFGRGLDRTTLVRALEDPSEEIRTLAAALLLDRADPDDARAIEASIESLLNGAVAGRRALARAIRGDRAGSLRELLAPLLDDPDPEVRIESIRTVGHLGDGRFVDRLIESLEDRSLRSAARVALGRLGPQGLTRMVEALADPETTHGVRRQLPEAIAAFATTQAARILVRHMRTERDGTIRFKILQALGRMRRRQPALPLDNQELRQARDHALRQASGLMATRRDLEGLDPSGTSRPPSERLLIGLLHDKQDHALERVFRLFNLETRNDDFYRIYQGLTSPKPDARAGARELLENLLAPAERAALVELVDDVFESPAPAAGGSALLHSEALRRLLDGPVESLTALAAATAVERGLVDLRDAIAAAMASSDDFHAVLTRAQAGLERQIGTQA